MSFKTVLVCLTTEPAALQIMPAACAISRAFGAHLIGIHTLAAIVPYPGIALHIDHPQYKIFNDQAAAQSARIEAVFQAQVAQEDFSAEYHTISAQSTHASDQLVQTAFRSDLVIASQPDPEHERYDQLGSQKDLIVNSGRPVLLIPPAYEGNGIGNRILLAWNATRESAAAAQGALPFMTRAEETIVLTVSAEQPHSISGDTEGHEVAKTLARHGVQPTVRHVSQIEASVGDQILAEAKANTCDLIVMGAFGHSRLHSFFFGDATRFMLEKADLPVLFAS